MDDLVDRARLGRRSGAALKVGLANLRSSGGAVIVFVFEGREDVGPYEAWIGRIDGELEYATLAGSGKGQLLDLRRRLRSDETGLSQNTFFFIDRDYDLLRGQTPGADVFCTDTYSIENALVSGKTLSSILVDEFRMDLDRDAVMNIRSHFGGLLDHFLGIMCAPNWRMFCRSLSSNKTGSISETISGYARIQWDSVSPAYTDDTLRELIPMSGEPEPGPDEVKRFESLDPIRHYRGKHLLAFFLSWLDALADALREGKTPYFAERISHKFSRGALNMRNLASRSELPSGLLEFIGEVDN